MLESLFSEQVVQPYLNEEFPVSKEAHDDRLFKHLTFYEYDEDIKIRLSAVDHNKIIRRRSSAEQKVIATNLRIGSPEIEIFRVKAVLSEPDFGVTDSYWLQERHQKGTEASTHNQYRIRGISSKGWRSDWTYSELRDYDNDLIVYNMLYDVLDLLLSVHDDQIDYLMDYIVSDTFAEIFKELAPDYEIALDMEDKKAVNIQEIMNLISKKEDTNPKEKLAAQLGERFLMLADELKKEFKENVMASSKEFAEIYKVYKLVDQLQDRQTDLLSLLVEIFLDERYEKLVEKTDIEVLLQNDEEMGIYLNGKYDFDIKGELIAAVCDASLDDRFVSGFSDAVQLISEPVVFENLVYGTDETVGRFIRMALAELFVPMLAMDQHLVELQTELEDKHESEIQEGIVEFTRYTDEVEVRDMLMFDIIEAAIKGDFDPQNDLHSTFVDTIIQVRDDKTMKLLVGYDFDEILNVHLDLGESFRQAYSKEFGHHKEEVTTGVSEKFASQSKTYTPGLADAYQTALNELYEVSPSLKKNPREQKEIGLVDAVMNEFKLFRNALQEKIDTRLNEELDSQDMTLKDVYQELWNVNTQEAVLNDDMTHGESLDEMKDILLGDKAKGVQITAYDALKDAKSTTSLDAYYNLFKHSLRMPSKHPILDRKDVTVQHNLKDNFLLDGEEKVFYAMGTMDDGFVLRTFKIGSNTVKGEEEIT